MILFDVTLSTTAETSAAFTALLRATQTASQAEKGCVIYRFTQDISDPHTFYLIELWETEADLMAHAKGEPFRNFLAEMPKVGKLVGSMPRQGDLAPYTFVRPS